MKIVSQRQPPQQLLFACMGLFALATGVLAGCSATQPGSAHYAAKQVFVYPNTGAIYVLPNWSTDPNASPDSDAGLYLDPAFAGDLYSGIVLAMNQIQLFSFDSALRPVPDAVSTYTRSADGKTWTMNLKPTLKWSDGKPLVAGDFVLGMQHYLDPNLCTTPGPLVSPFAQNRVSCSGQQTQLSFLQFINGASEYANGKAKTIQGIQAPDDHTLIFTLTQSISYFPSLLSTPASMPIEQSVFAQYGSSYINYFPTGVGQSGPFIIQSWTDPTKPNVNTPNQSTTIKFIRNPNWTGKQPILTEISMPLVKTQEDMYRQYQQGKLDYTQVPDDQYQYVRDLPDFHTVQALQIDYFAMNHTLPPFNNLKVRQAFDLALNKQYLVDTIFQGARSPTNHIIPNGIAGYNRNLLNPPDASGSAALTGNQDLAKQLIQQVATQCYNKYDDWCEYVIGKKPDKNITEIPNHADCPAYKVGTTTDANGAVTSNQKQIVAYAPSNRASRIVMTQQSALQWASVLCLNVTSNAEKSFSDLYYQNIKKGKVSLWTVGFSADYPDPQDFTTSQFGTNSGNNDAHFTDDALNKAMQAADSEPDVQKREKAYADIEQSLVWQVAWLPYDQPKYLYRVRTTVVGLVVPGTQIISDQTWVNVYIEQS